MMTNGSMSNSGAPPPPPPPPLLRNNSNAAGHNREMSNGSLSMPNGPTLNGAPILNGPRSPPGKQNTSHVPCKFFRQGTCQAGKTCPFSHENTADTICKYFSKGNCKFGAKCANVHVLPDGRRVTYTKHGPTYTQPMSPMNLGGRVNTEPYNNSPLGHGFMGHPGMGPAFPYSPMRNPEEAFSAPDSRPGGMDFADVPTIDTTYASHQNSAHGGSPRDDIDLPMRSSLGFSPGSQALNIMDAPLPASFDSNGVSLLYRNGPQASSVPNRHIPNTLPTSSGALKELHYSAYGDADLRDRMKYVPPSPPSNADGYFPPRRSMHIQQIPKRRELVSASAPTLPQTSIIDTDWDMDFDNEEEYLPGNLEDLLTPIEKARRGSRYAEEEGRPIHSGAGTPADSSKFGSPSKSGSPSRWGPNWSDTQPRDEEKIPRLSQFGHVGSPLRNSILQAAIANGISSRPTPRSRSSTSSGDASSYVASSPRQSQWSLIAQGIQRVRISNVTNESGHHVGSPGSLSRSVTSNPATSRRELAGERASNSSTSTAAGRFATVPIDEEQAEGVFNMDEDEAASTKKRSGGFRDPVAGRSPHLSTLGSKKSPSALAKDGKSRTTATGSTSSISKLFKAVS